MSINKRMEAQNNKTIMCSILFLDIVGYSKCSVAGQISLKERFNRYLSQAILDTPLADRVILDTGDGAAVNFIGDVEDALKVGLIFRNSLHKEEEEHPLHVRIGINLGPVRLVRDINGQPNVVGDGINVAQRIMGFSEINQVLVSRSYYDAVSRLLPEYASLFHYQGSRTDKHVREHEVYAINQPGEPAVSEVVAGGSGIGHNRRYLYIALIMLAIVLLGIGIKLTLRGDATPPPVTEDVLLPSDMMQQDTIEKDIVIPEVEVSIIEDTPSRVYKRKKIIQKRVTKKVDKTIGAVSPIVEMPDDGKVPVTDKSSQYAGSKIKDKDNDSFISVRCKSGTEVFVDGHRRGRLGDWPLLLTVAAGKHIVLLSVDREDEPFLQEVVTIKGKTTPLRLEVCN